MKKFTKLIISVLLCEAVGLISASFTMSSDGSWYQTLNKPFLSPPNWIFAPVWTVLYFTMGVSLYLIWINTDYSQKVRPAFYIFFLQLLLNFLWSILFFGLRAPFFALIDIALLWFTIVICIQKFLPLSKIAAYLLIPYLAWVSFALYLNLGIVLLNP